MEYLYCSLIGYGIGTFNPSYLIGKNKGFDIRRTGSGNAGASNALILFGKAVGFICAVLDILKAFLAVRLTKKLFPGFQHCFAVTGSACVLGHIFPFYMGFRGGKGLACLGGIILAYNWKLFLLMLAAELLVALITDYICFVPVTAALALPILYAIIEKDRIGALILGIVTVVVFIKHTENFKRILNGTELHLSFLWRPQAEVNRIKANFLWDRGEEDPKPENKEQ